MDGFFNVLYVWRGSSFHGRSQAVAWGGLSGLAISGRGAVKAWLAIRQGVGSYPTPAGMSSQVSAWAVSYTHLTLPTIYSV